MSGLEVFAVVTSAAQLLDMTLRGVESAVVIRQRIAGAAGVLNLCRQRLQTFVSLMECIKNNPALQTQEIIAYLTRSLPKVTRTQASLESFSRSTQKKLSLAVITGRAQRTVLEHLDTLQSTLAELIVHITSLNTSKLCKIEENIDSLLLTTQQSSVETASTHTITLAKAERAQLHTAKQTSVMASRKEPFEQSANNWCNWYGQITIKGNSTATIGTLTDAESGRPDKPLTAVYQHVELERTSTGRPRAVLGPIGPPDCGYTQFGRTQISDADIQAGPVVDLRLANETLRMLREKGLAEERLEKLQSLAAERLGSTTGSTNVAGKSDEDCRGLEQPE